MQFQILGPLRVLDRHGRELPLSGTKPAALLALLLIRANEVVPSDRLIEDLWDGRPPPTAAKTLQVYVSRLRHVLGSEEHVVSRPGGYLLDVDAADVDALRFEQLVNEGCAALAERAHARASARLRSALALWRGDALADFTYASFAQEPIARLDALRTVALESALEAELALGRHAESIPELQSLVKANPLNEHLRAELMLALYRAGRQAEALGAYRAGRRLLVDELGIEPGERLRELESAILAQDPVLAPASAPRVPTGQPRPSTGLFVGYEQELGTLEQELEKALEGDGRLVLVSGEAGIGKTRLAEELCSVARARGAQVAWGRSWEMGGTPAFWSWIQVMRALSAPELSDFAGTDAVATPEDERFRLFDAAAGFLRRAAADAAIVIVLDDLHAADPSSLALLRFMSTGVTDARILILGTYRDREVGAGHPLAAALDGMTRSCDCLQLVLTGLTSADTTHFVEVSAGAAPLPVVAAAVHRATDGNPLFVSELVRLLRAEDRLRELAPGEELVLPRGIEQVIARRLERLSEPCRRALGFAAVIGRGFDVALLARVSGLGGDELLDVLGDALAAGVIEERIGDPEALWFSHELVRASLYSGLPVPERRRMHLAVAHALESIYGTGPDAPVAELAHHFEHALPAGDPKVAVEYLTRAGGAAAALSANREAAADYERAARVADTNAVGADVLCELEVKAAEQSILASDTARTREALARAEAMNGAAPDEGRMARLAIVRAQHDILVGATGTRPDRIRKAIALFERLGDQRNQARAWWAMFMWRTIAAGQFTSAAEAAEEMLERAREAGSRELTAQAIRAVASALGRIPIPVPDAIQRLRALLPTAPDAVTEARILVALADLEAARGRFDEGRALIARARKAVAPAELEAVDWTGGILLAQLELLAGNPRAAEDLARAECMRDEGRGATGYLASDLTYLAAALIDQGRLGEAEAEVERAEAITGPQDADAMLRQARCRALIELARGDYVTAERSIRIALHEGERIESPEIRAESLLVLARILRAAGRDDEARSAGSEALALSEARGHEVFEARARTFLAGEGAVRLAFV